ncbi:hypothetical protein [Phenylobacterium sp.]|uniref:hypothetical protein n=1 Tax=Phenylobacterium sp. TaxID=1871053 RepID=UPI003BAC1BF9
MRPWALPLLGALILTACAKPEPPTPPLVLDCDLGFEALSAKIAATPGMKPAVKERGEPFHYFNAKGGQTSYMVTEPGAPGHPAILKQEVTPSGIVNSGCPYGDAKGYAELTAYLQALARARAK